MKLASALVVDQRGAVDMLTEKGLELLEIAAQDDIQGVTEDMDRVTSKYDDLKATIREKLCELNLTWQAIATNVGFHLIYYDINTYIQYYFNIFICFILFILSAFECDYFGWKITLSLCFMWSALFFISVIIYCSY